MAVEREVRYRCDGCGEYVARDTVTVVRVGTPDDRPEDCERLDIGHECLGRTLRQILARELVTSVEG